jgi:hypothetical protein
MWCVTLSILRIREKTGFNLTSGSFSENQNSGLPGVHRQKNAFTRQSFHPPEANFRPNLDKSAFSGLFLQVTVDVSRSGHDVFNFRHHALFFIHRKRPFSRFPSRSLHEGIQNSPRCPVPACLRWL